MTAYTRLLWDAKEAMNHMEFDKAYFDAGIDRVGTECEKWDGMI